MALLRNAQEKNQVLIFDSGLDHASSTYESKHLDSIATVEENHFWFRTRRDKICQLFEQFVDKKSRILEIGAGTGFVAEKLKNLGFSVEVSDIHSNGLQYARKKGIEKLYQFDLFNPPFEEEFDVVCLFDVLEHLSDPSRALSCLKQMLKPGGLIILTVPAHRWLWSREDLIAGHHQRFSKKTLQQVFISANLKPLSIRYFFLAILPLLVLRKWIKKDAATPLKTDEHVDLKLNPLFNKLLYLATKSEFYLDRLLPNIMGGSLIAVAQKIQ